MPLTSKDIRRKKPSESRHVIVDFQNALDRDDTINETIASLLGVTADGLSISGEAITGVMRKVNGRYCPAGKAVTFLAAGGQADTDYAITVQVQTSGGQIIDRTLILQVRAV
jgi:hypothetical protein